MHIRNIKNNWLTFAVLAVVVLAVYGNALFNGFVYDDHYLIKDNPFIRSFVHLPTVLTSDVTVTTPIAKPSGYYRPVSMLFLMMMYKVWGLNTFGLHLMSVLIHLANTFLVFVLIRRLSSDALIAFVAGLLFAVHPIHVEAVTPIFNFMGILASFFSLLSFYFFLKAENADRGKNIFLSLLCCLLAVFSKEEAIILPAVFVLYDIYFVAQFQVKNFLKRLPTYLWYTIPVAACLLARALVMKKAAAFGFWHLNLGFNIISDSGLLSQAITTFKIFSDYLGILLFPFSLSAFYLLPQPDVLPAKEIFGMVFVVLGVLALACVSAKKHKLVSFFIFFFFITSFMVSNIIPVGGLFAERFMYLPSVAFCVLAAYVLVNIYRLVRARNEQLGRGVFLITLVLVGGLYAQASAARNYVWRNDITLWSDACQKTPHSAKPFHCLGDAYAYHGSLYYNKALEAYHQALQRPDAPKIVLYNSIGTLYGLMGRYDLALAAFLRAFQLNKNIVTGYYNLGVTYYYTGDNATALSYFQQGLKIDKNYFWLYYGIGLVRAKEGKQQEARAMFTRALTLEPRFEAAKTALEKL